MGYKDESLNDEQLYDAFLKGEYSALDELLIRHKDGLTFFLMGFVNSKEDAEDILMDTFALLIAKKAHFKEESSFKTWLYGIGRNLAKKHMRKVARTQTLPLDETLVSENGSLFQECTQLSDDSSKKALYKAIDSLNEEYRTVIYLIYFQNMNINQVAKVMKKSVKQIYNITSRAKDRLRDKIDLDE